MARQCESLLCQDRQKNRHLRLFCISEGTLSYGLTADSGVFVGKRQNIAQVNYKHYEARDIVINSADAPNGVSG